MLREPAVKSTIHTGRDSPSRERKTGVGSGKQESKSPLMYCSATHVAHDASWEHLRKNPF